MRDHLGHTVCRKHLDRPSADKLGMPRKPRRLEVAPGHPHHVWFRGNNRRAIYSSDLERRTFSHFLSDALTKYACALHAAALLTNHGHLVLTPDQPGGISRCLKATLQRYALWRNRRRGGSGKLFEARFGCRRVRSERYLATVIAYVDLNLRRAGIYRPTLSRWTTLGLHAGIGETTPALAALWTPSPWYLALGAAPAPGRLSRARLRIRDAGPMASALRDTRYAYRPP